MCFCHFFQNKKDDNICQRNWLDKTWTGKHFSNFNYLKYQNYRIIYGLFLCLSIAFSFFFLFAILLLGFLYYVLVYSKFFFFFSWNIYASIMIAKLSVAVKFPQLVSIIQNGFQYHPFCSCSVLQFTAFEVKWQVNLLLTSHKYIRCWT